MPATTSADGRRARRERNRAAVIDAVFELLVDGQVPPAVEDVAARAEVSVSSVFRYFESLDDLHEQTIARYFERYEALFELPAVPDGDRAARIDALVQARVELYERIAPLARFARQRAGDQARLAATLHETRQRLAGQVRAHFAIDLAGRAPADADDVAALIDVLTSFEAWDLLRATHGRRGTGLARAWVLGIESLLTR